MSMSVSRRSSATGHPTRQQLDELDALLKRMLDLPVNRLEDEADAIRAGRGGRNGAPPGVRPGADAARIAIPPRTRRLSRRPSTTVRRKRRKRT